MVVEVVVHDDERLERVRAAPAELTVATSQTLAAVLLFIRRSQRLKKTETPQKKPPEVHGLGPTISRRSTVSQRLGARGSVASGALRSFLSD